MSMSSISNQALRLLSVGALVFASSMTLPSAAHAQLSQLFFDWGGGNEKVNDSGRQSVRINTDAKPGEIIVSFTDRKLYLITAPGRANSYPVAIPREQDRWEGKTTVTQKRENPSWTPTPTMIKENPRLPRWVPGGHPMNPLGVRALYLGSSMYRIHGTDAPWTIGTAVSKGCIRMYNKDAQDVYELTKIGAKVLVTWNKYDATPDGEATQASAAREEAPVSARATSAHADRAPIAPSSASAAPATAPSSASAATSSEHKVAQSGSRYSDIFGTPEPPAPGVTQPRASGSSTQNQQQGQRSARPPAERSEAQGSSQGQGARESRRSREAANEGAGSATKSEAAPAATSQPRMRSSETKASAEHKERATSVETGSLSERAKPRGKPAADQAAAATVAPAQVDAATRALEAAERAAAAAERAAAAAERAEKALSARAAAAVAAPAPVVPAAAATVPASAPASPAPAVGGGD